MRGLTYLFLHHCKLLANTVPRPGREGRVEVGVSVLNYAIVNTKYKIYKTSNTASSTVKVFTKYPNLCIFFRESVWVKLVRLREVGWVSLENGHEDEDLGVGRNEVAAYLHLAGRHSLCLLYTSDAADE